VINLASAWNPRGEFGRLEKIMPFLSRRYNRMVFTVPPFAAPEVVDRLAALLGDGLVVTKDWSHGRYQAVAAAAQPAGSWVHYVDGDRLIRWVETRPEEWQSAIERVAGADVLVFGRTEAAWETHPQALRQTERITSSLFSHLLGSDLDLSAGSKGFSPKAVEFLLANSAPGRALGTDAEWIVLLRRGGFQIGSVLVDGLDWEIPDRYQNRAAETQRQIEVREAYDREPKNWAMRVGVANEIAEAGLAALTRELVFPVQGDWGGRGDG
jgi:hypothetical protein